MTICRNHLRIPVPIVSCREGEDLFHVPRQFRLQAAPLAAVLIVGSIGASMSGHSSYLISNGVYLASLTLASVWLWLQFPRPWWAFLLFCFAVVLLALPVLSSAVAWPAHFTHFLYLGGLAPVSVLCTGTMISIAFRLCSRSRLVDAEATDDDGRGRNAGILDLLALTFAVATAAAIAKEHYRTQHFFFANGLAVTLAIAAMGAFWWITGGSRWKSVKRAMLLTGPLAVIIFGALISVELIDSTLVSRYFDASSLDEAFSLVWSFGTFRDQFWPCFVLSVIISGFSMVLAQSGLQFTRRREIVPSSTAEPINL